MPSSFFGCLLQDVAMLSQFPAEAEILFAPLTGLEVIRSEIDKTDQGVQVYQVRLSCNLRDQTLEQVVSKMQRSHIALIESTLERLRFDAPEAALVPLKEALEKAEERGGEFFNVESFYEQATSEALEARKDCFKKTLDERNW
jgi:ABC-type phosphate transport system auxiliary subunit